MNITATIQGSLSYSILALFLACSAQPEQRVGPPPAPEPVRVDLSTPEKTFQTLVRAVRSRDLDTYRMCFVPERVDSEGEASKLAADPERWDELGAIFRGTQEFRVTSEGDDRVKARVEAPDADGGGIGGITFERRGRYWLVYSW